MMRKNTMITKLGKQWIQLELSNDWGHYFWRDADLHHGSISYFDEQSVKFARKKVRVKWPDGRESEEFLINKNDSMQIREHGRSHAYVVTSTYPVLAIIEDDEIVEKPLSDVLIWHEEIVK
jgi:hypothetical protein